MEGEIPVLVLGGVPITLVVLGLTTLAGNWVSGKAQLVVALVIGLVVGGLYNIGVANALPTDIQGWITLVVYGLGWGVVSSGIYETWKKPSKKA